MFIAIFNYLVQNNFHIGLARVMINTTITLGLIYILGRMLEVVTSDHKKNIIAVLLFYFIAYAQMTLFFPQNELKYIIWDVFCYGTYPVIPYVLLAWKLYDRVTGYFRRKGFGTTKRTTKRVKNKR